MKNSISILKSNLIKNLQGKQNGAYCVCCTNEDVLLSALQFAKNKHYPLIIESTSNQVDQFGGYTGMRPKDFVKYIYKLADDTKYPKNKIILGGDHLGPNAWQNENSDIAMEKAKILIADYVRVGYRKIHLDASMPCADDKLHGHILDDEIVAQRAAILCKIAETEWKNSGTKQDAPVYIIGTEVPVPGGSKDNSEQVEVTSNKAATKTYEITKNAFKAMGLESAWNRVIAMVVQPGVEFSDDTITQYNSKNSKSLSALANKFNLVFEAHSTDYQTKSNLFDLVKNHFAILKVGPWLTYAYREALCLLAEIEEELIKYKLLSKSNSNFKNNISKFIEKNPKYWNKYYKGKDNEKAYKCIYSLSDRIRYYWPMKEMKNYIGKLLSNLSNISLPYSLVSQYFPQAIETLEPQEFKAKNLIQNHIQEVLKKYDFAVN